MPTSFAPPAVAPIPPGFFTAFSWARVRGTQPKGAPPTDPWLFALVTRSYQAAPGARNALRHDLHATGVI